MAAPKRESKLTEEFQSIMGYSSASGWEALFLKKQRKMAQLTQEQKEMMRKLFDENGLREHDIHTQTNRAGKFQYVIIKRTGIEKIQYKNQIQVEFECVSASPDYAAVKGVFWKKGDTDKIPTFGSACKNTCTSKYYLEMAEKRCLARGVLKNINAYEYGFFSEDEQIDEFGLDK